MKKLVLLMVLMILIVSTLVSARLNLTLISVTTGKDSPTFLNEPRDIQVIGDLAFIASNDNDGFSIYNISDRTNPISINFVNQTGLDAVGQSNIMNQARNLFVITEVDAFSDNANKFFNATQVIYISSRSSDKIAQFNITDKKANLSANFLEAFADGDPALNDPRGIFVLDNQHFLINFTVDNKRLLFATGEDSDAFYIYDVLNPFGVSNFYTKSGAGTPNFLNGAIRVIAKSNVSFVTSQVEGALSIYNFTNVQDVRLFSTFTTADSILIEQPKGFDFVNDKIYIATRNQTVLILNVSDLEAPTLMGSLTNSELYDNLNDIVVKNDIAYVASGGNIQRLIILNVSDPTNIFPISNISSSGEIVRSGHGVASVVVDDLGFIYAVSQGNNSLFIFNITGVTVEAPPPPAPPITALVTLPLQAPVELVGMIVLFLIILGLIFGRGIFKSK